MCLENFSALGQLGLLAEEQGHWDAAIKNILTALEIFIEFRDQHNVAIALSSLARLWQATNDPKIITEISRILGVSQEDAKKLLEGKG